jgi:predicted nucleic acid-binding Zn ribbon protein
MHCPECNSLNESDTAACSNCGLLLLTAAPAAPPQPLKRRSEDYAGQKRRAADQASQSCKFCGGEIPLTAVRCKHCSEVVDENFYRERAARLRSRVNYASWVAYLFGLGALLVFRPVGVLSIATGLLLSIAYYAIPVEPPASPRNKKKTRLGTLIRRQLKMERVAIPIPALRNKKLVFVGTPLIAALIGYSANLFLLQEPVNDVLKENSALAGMHVSAHYQYWVIPGVVIYDIEGLSAKQTPLDVHTAFVEFASKLKEKRYSRVELSYKGTTKFSMNGEGFQRVGIEYARKNLAFALYGLPHLLQPENGTQAIDKANSDRDALLEFHRRWYGDDQLTKTVRNGL